MFQRYTQYGSDARNYFSVSTKISMYVFVCLYLIYACHHSFEERIRRAMHLRKNGFRIKFSWIGCRLLLSNRKADLSFGKSVQSHNKDESY